jgi:RNA polymerase sigma-70 factor (ECF subfamily)
MTVEPDDRTLADRCRAGDEAASVLFVERHERRVFNVALRMLGNREDARDVAQTTFIKAFRNLEGYDPAYSLATWIGRIVVNECLNLLAGRRRSEPLDEQVPADDRGALETTFVHELRAAIEQGLRTLGMEYRMVLILRHFMECSYGEMAAILDLPEKTVKSRLFTARQLLRDALERQGIHR